jgi:hypothetical protein
MVSLLAALKRYRRPLLLAALALAAWRLSQARFWRAQQFEPRIRAALEQSLQRRVEIQGDVSYRLFGFAAAQVIVHEDPSFSPEPIAYVASLETSISLVDLLRGRLRFSQLLLDEPSINIAQGSQQGMNVLPLAQRALTAGRGAGEPLPNIRIRNGRLNFVMNRRKSVFYLRRVDLTVTAQDESTLRIDFEGEPARTDRRSVGFGRFTTRGRIQFPPGGEPSVDLDLDLNRSNLGEVASLFEPKAVNLNGRVDTEARLKGPASAVRIEGKLRLDPQLQRDLLNPGPPPLEYQGVANLRDQTLELDAKPDSRLPAAIRFRAREILQNPRWAALVRLNELPGTGLIAFWRNGPMPALHGKLTGAFSIRGNSVKGMAEYAGPGPEHPVRRARLVADGSLIEFQSELDGAPIAPLREILTGVTGFTPGFLADVTEGALAGSVEYRFAGPDGPPVWSGVFRASPVLNVAGLADRVKVQEAEIRLTGNNMTVESFQARIGQIDCEGSYRYEMGAPMPHRFTLLIPRADWAEASRLLEPSLRTSSFLSRTLGLPGGAVPDWILERRAEGVIRIGQLTANSTEIGPVKARMRWSGARVEFEDVEAGSMRGAVSGEFTASGVKFQSTGSLQFPN